MRIEDAAALGDSLISRGYIRNPRSRMCVSRGETRTTTISLPSDVAGRRYVCYHTQPADDPADRMVIVLIESPTSLEQAAKELAAKGRQWDAEHAH